jgi:hypothetical protein
MIHRKSEKPNQDEHEMFTLLELHCRIIRDVAISTGVDLSRDITTVQHRTRHEGISFLTKTLPGFGKEVLNSFQSGVLRRDNLPFKGVGRHEALPAFLQGLLKQLFDQDGILLSDPSATAAWGVYQICAFLYKYELPYTESQLQTMVQKWRDIEDELKLLDLNQGLNSLEGMVLFLAEQNAREVLRDLDLSDILLRHGPGAVSEGGLNQFEKFSLAEFPTDCEVFYDSSEYLHPSLSLASHVELRDIRSDGHCSFLSVDSAPSSVSSDKVSRMSGVPKDSRGPRLISAEPVALAALQGGQGQAIQSYLESHPLTAGHINFTDQRVNGRLALEASLTGHWATLDMESASDRLSDALARALLPGSVYKRLAATRSVKTKLPSGEVVELQKFAPMGSGVCFPVESFVFWILSTSYLMCETGWSFARAAKSVYTYGDDLIVPAVHAPGLMLALEGFGLKFNKAKSFVSGPFRESCGTDAFKGRVITPLRLKKRMPQSKKDVESIVSWTAMSNALHKAGLWSSADYCRKVVESRIGRQPVVPDNSGCIGWYSFCGRHDKSDPMWKDEKVPPLWVTKSKGNGFKMIARNPAPYFQGKKAKLMFPTSPALRPGLREFSEAKALLRQIGTSTASHPFSREYEIPVAQGGGSARIFGQRYCTVLRKKWLYIT